MLHASFLIGHLNYYVGYAGVYNKYMLQQTLYTLYINNTRVPSMSMQCIILHIAVLYVQDNLDTFAYLYSM